MTELNEDLLIGADEIACFYGVATRRIYALAAANRIPTFKLGQAICARRSTCLKHLEDQEDTV